MCVFKIKKHYLAAKAWHDHGHENNPKVPRWEDTRMSSGFNFRMTEIQALMGWKQLLELDDYVEKRNIIKDEYILSLKQYDFVPQKIDENVKHNCQSIVFKF